MGRVGVVGLVLWVALAAPSRGDVPLDYYLPAGTDYDPAVPTPESHFGFQVGQWHLHPEQLVAYLRAVSRASDRVTLTEYARTYENRPLVVLTVTAPEHHARLEQIRRQHLALSDPARAAAQSVDDMPVVVYMGYSIHGNEASGSNAAALVAYHLAAARGPEMEALLDEAVILLDPSFNPDGMARFAQWANMHRGRQPVGDPLHREHTEAWPGGRTNHYWFDLNRDWLLAQHPESQGRLEVFHRWKPNLLTDHHEMGSDNTFFFQPGIPSRNNPLTPARTFELTAAIAERHARALDEIGSLYYTQESFDDFYAGKGSTYPDLNGGVGILFEQASVRGHLRENAHGERSFAFAIRNQVTTSLSTLQAARELRVDLLTHQRDFARSAVDEADDLPMGGYVFGGADDPARLYHFVELLQRHRIRVHGLTRRVEIDGAVFEPGAAWVVPVKQPQQRLVRAVFETRTSFTDSVFYDVSAWTVPLAFGLPSAELRGRRWKAELAGDALAAASFPAGSVDAVDDAYAYAFSWAGSYAPRALYRLLAADVRAYVATRPFTAATARGPHAFDYGTIVVPARGQAERADTLRALLDSAAVRDGLRVHAVRSGLTPEGINLGSPKLVPVTRPEVAIAVGDGVSSYEAGEAWHLLDRRYHMPVSLVERDRLRGTALDRYTAILLVDGGYGELSQDLVDWVRDGGTLVAVGGAARRVLQDSLITGQLRGAEPDTSITRRAYVELEQDRGAQVIGGAILAADLDRTHPLGFGMPSRLHVLRRGTVFFSPVSNPYATPLRYTEEPLVSGYLSARNAERAAGAAGIVVGAAGRGRVVLVADKLTFRAYWFGTQKLLANALFFAPVVNAAGARISR